MNFTKARIAERRSAPDPLPRKLDEVVSADFLTKFLSKHTEDPEAFSMYHVLMGCTSNMVAGSDTTAISLSAVLYYLLRHPDVLQRLREELEQWQEKGPPSKYVTFKESQGMPYLQAVIKEALRMHPAVGLPLERVVPPGGAEICNRFFPMGVSAKLPAEEIFSNNSFAPKKVRCWNQLLGYASQSSSLWGRCQRVQARAVADRG